MECGVEINIAKSKTMRVKHSNRIQLKIDNHEVELIDSFCYLRNINETDGGRELDNNCRMSGARAPFRLPQWKE